MKSLSRKSSAEAVSETVSGAVAIVAVAGAAMVYPLSAGAVGNEGVTVQHMRYQESDDRMAVEYTQVSGAKDFGTDFRLTASASIDAMSGATPAVDAKTGASAMSGDYLLGDGLASADGYTTHFIEMEDERTAFNSALTWRTKNRHEWTGGISHSSEEDYNSNGVSIEHLHHLDASRNRSLSVGYSRLENEALFYRDGSWRDATYQTIEVGITEVLSPTALIRMSAYTMTEDGELSNPYKRIIRKVNVAGEDGVTFRYYLSPDARPDERKVAGIDIKAVKQTEVLYRPAYFHAQYRLYRDNWGVDAHTIDGKAYWGELDESVGQVFLALRYYMQSAASFYKEPDQVFDELGYGSVDERLSEYTDTTLSIGWERNVTEHWLISARSSWQTQSTGLDMTWNWLGVNYAF